MLIMLFFDIIIKVYQLLNFLHNIFLLDILNYIY